MKLVYRKFGSLSAFIIAVALSVSPCAAESAEIRLRDGTKWRGDTSDVVEVRFVQNRVELTITGRITKIADLYIRVFGEVAGVTREKIVFKSDVISIKSTGKRGDQGEVRIDRSETNSVQTSDPRIRDDKKVITGKRPMGVFVLPLVGTVGVEFRHNEIDALGREADKYGPGQIIVLHIDSGGGLVVEMEQIHRSMMELKKRHRVVAWIKEAISAGAATAIHCDEIYFMKTGSLGAMTMFAGGRSAKGAELQRWLDLSGNWMELGGRSKYIAWAMIDDEALLSYDKNPVTGEVTWYNDLSGGVDLSDSIENLVFNASSAMACGFADGVADTEEELAKLLDLENWHEISDYGRRVADDWRNTVKRAQREIPRLVARSNYKGTGSGDPAVVIGTQISIFNELLRWWDRCPNVCFELGVPPKDYLDRTIAQLQKQLSDMRN